MDYDLQKALWCFQEDRSNSVTIGVADDHIGLVVGRGGRNIMEISQVYK